MPELPDITVYIEALEKRILGQRLEKARINSPFLLRSVEPPVTSAVFPWSDCPVTFMFFSALSFQFRIPRSGSPDWQPPASGCPV